MAMMKAGNAGNFWAIRKFSKASAPALAPYLRPAGNIDIGDLTLKLIGHVLSRGSLGITA